MSYRIEGLDPAAFRALFELDDRALAKHCVERSFVEEPLGTPCRVSLADAEVGDEVLLLGYAHLSADSPYRASGPIFVRRRAVEEQSAAAAFVDTVPDVLARRVLSVRAYDSAAIMRRADVCEGTALDARIDAMFEDGSVAFLHVHYAKQGCYAARVVRAN